MKYLYIMAVLLLSASAYAQKTGWKELDNFHTMVPPLLHTAGAGDLAPIKKNSTALLHAAQKWQSSKSPKGSDTPKYKDDLAELVKECAALNDAVKTNKVDTVLQVLADKTHKTFHMILSETIADTK